MTDRPGFVLVHGAWHDARSWAKVVARLQAHGFVAKSLDLPGADAATSFPASYERRPLDREAFAAESTPRRVTQAERTAATLSVVEEVAEHTGRPVVLVGHSLGGVTVSDAVESRPELVAAAVYVAAFMLPTSVAVVDLIGSAAMATSTTPALFLADPAVVGALRIDPRSADGAYVALIRDSFYADVDNAIFADALVGMHPDEPFDVFLQPSAVTPGHYGTVERHYVRTSDADHTIVPDAQQYMITTVDQAMPHPTVVHQLPTGHSPFASQPDALADVLEAVVDAVGE